MCAIERLADAMEAEGITDIRRYSNGTFAIHLSDGRWGLGTTPREAINAATYGVQPERWAA